MQEWQVNWEVNRSLIRSLSLIKRTLVWGSKISKWKRDISNCFKDWWCMYKTVSEHKTLPFLAAAGTPSSKEQSDISVKKLLPIQVSQLRHEYEEIWMLTKFDYPKTIKLPEIEFPKPWDTLMVWAKAPGIHGSHGILLFSENHHISFKRAFIQGTDHSVLYGRC